MATISLRYGRTAVDLEYSEERFQVLQPIAAAAPLTDLMIGHALDDPIGSDPLESKIKPGETVLFVVPDGTRSAAAGQIVNLVVRRLIANGTMPHEMAAIFATGIHRAVTGEEKRQILSPFLAQRLKLLDHSARDLVQIIPFGETSGGITVELNRVLKEFDHVISVGSVRFHYFAGFTGGRKLICPGLASSRTIAATHKLAFDCTTHQRTEGVGPGKLEGNPVNAAFEEAAALANVSFAINTIVDDSGNAVAVFCGDPRRSHRAACEHYASGHTISIPEKRPLVVASCGGDPFDLNMIQAHKAIAAATDACAEGGSIILLAECADGLGRSDFLQWFSAANSRELAERLCSAYKVNGQTAWSLLEKAERFDIRLLTGLEDETVRKMRLSPIGMEEIKNADTLRGAGYIIPNGSSVLIRETNPQP